MSPAQTSQLSSESTRGSLPFRGIFAHAWDYAHGNIDAWVTSLKAMGLNTISLATTYHSGWFLHPQHPHHRAFMTEGSVCYFQPQDSLYKQTCLRPKISKLTEGRDLLSELSTRLNNGLQLVSWTIGAHNTRLGSLYPELTQQNVYGDRLPHALCFANRDVRAYLKALCRDLATNYPLWGIQLEAFGWMSLQHGHHHERDLVGLTPLEQDLISLCLCPACSAAANRVGVDILSVKATIKEVLDAAFREAPQRPPNHPDTMKDLEEKAPDLASFNQWRKAFTDSFIKEIRTESLGSTKCRLLLQSASDLALTDTVDGFACGAYGELPEKVFDICHANHAALPKHWQGLLQCFIQLGAGVPQSEKQLDQIIDAVRLGGCNGINFYNLSESPPKMLSWLKGILPNYSK